MKLIPILSAAAFLSLSALTSCSNYLDIVPDEAEQLEDTYADKGKARDFLYSCYAYLPNPANTPGGLDLLLVMRLLQLLSMRHSQHSLKGVTRHQTL